MVSAIFATNAGDRYGELTTDWPIVMVSEAAAATGTEVENFADYIDNKYQDDWWN